MADEPRSPRRKKKADGDASANGNGSAGAPPAPAAKLTNYTVGRATLNDDGTVARIEVLELARSAKTQFAAMDAVMEEVPPTERNGLACAFLTGSLRFKEYETKTEPVTSSKPVQIAGLGPAS